MPLGSTGLLEQSKSSVPPRHGSHKVRISGAEEALGWELFHPELMFTR